MTTFTVSDLARRVGADVLGDPDRRLSGVASLDVAGPEDLAFFAREAMREAVRGTRAGAVLTPRSFEPAEVRFSVLKVDDPHLSFAAIVRLFHPEPPPAPGTHPSARVDEGARIGEAVSVGPGAVVEDGARVGSGTWVGPGTLIGRGARVGVDCRLGHAVSVLHGVELGDRVRVHAGARIGTDGFGYVPGPDGAHKVPQIGGCVIGDDVEIGANCTIDRGALDDTRIGTGRSSTTSCMWGTTCGSGAIASSRRTSASRGAVRSAPERSSAARPEWPATCNGSCTARRPGARWTARGRFHGWNRPPA